MKIWAYKDQFDDISFVIAGSYDEAVSEVGSRVDIFFDLKVEKETDRLTWDDIYLIANNTGYGSDALTAKDNARGELRYVIFETDGIDIEDDEEVESAEEYIDSFLARHPDTYFFNEDGYLIKNK